MLNIISELKPNKQAILKIERAQKQMDIGVLIGKRPKPLPQPESPN